MNPEKLKELNDGFDLWFSRLLHEQPSCLDRDVLREPTVKMAMRHSYIQWYGEYQNDND